jgi:hypothetical protein
LDKRPRSLGKLNLPVRVKAIELQYRAAELAEHLQRHEDAVLVGNSDLIITIAVRRRITSMRVTSFTGMSPSKGTIQRLKAPFCVTRVSGA